MKKDFIFVPILLIVSVLLALLKFTGMTVHIALSVVGVIVLITYTVLTKKEWKIPALEIGMRASYGIALITGIILKINSVTILGVAHRIFAVLFLILLIVLFVLKLTSKKNKN